MRSPATTKIPSTTTTLVDQLRDYDERMQAEARSRWRGWAERVADGGDLPTPRELLEAANTLGLTDPGRKLHEDAQAVQEYQTYRRTAAMCRSKAAEKLEPFGGRIERLLAEINTVEERLRSLRVLYDECSGGCCAGHWESVAYRVAREHPRVLGMDAAEEGT